MKEKTFATKFRVLFEKKFPKGFYFKIPDTKGLGGLRPFDAFAVVNGHPFALEYKLRTNKPTPHQEYFLKKFSLAGGISILVYQGTEYPVLNYMGEKCKQKRQTKRT